MPRKIEFELGPANPRTFSGSAFTGLIAGAEKEVSAKLYYVRFEPGATTNWHAHSGVQLLVVTAGRCRYAIDGGPVREIGAGESVRFEPGVRHWHGAAANQSAEHIAINLDNRETTWMEPVDEVDYRG